jgi:transcriptional regulator with XRE-family HTH domain
MLTPRQISKRLLQRRNHLGLSQEALATAADVSPETIRRLERGDTQPNLFTFCKVAEALGSTASVMLAETQDQEATGLLTMLPQHDQEIVLVMLRALAVHTAAR